MTTPPEDHTPRSKPPALDRAREMKQAANALIEWANAQEISRTDLSRIMSLVQAKIVVDTVRHDVFALSQSLDDFATALANDINNRLHQVRSDIRLGKRNNG